MKLSKKILSTTLSVLLFSAPIVRMSASAESMLYNTWKAIACHEMGHVLGLDHCKKDGNVSIMIEDGVSVYYDQLNLSTPQQMDINAIADKYQYLR